MLGDAREVEIREENGRIVIVPLQETKQAAEEDPLLGLGEKPVPCGRPDASENHDTHLYDA